MLLINVQAIVFLAPPLHIYIVIYALAEITLRLVSIAFQIDLFWPSSFCYPWSLGGSVSKANMLLF